MSYIYYDPLGGLFLFMAAYWWLWIVSSIVVGGVTAVIALTAPRLVGPEPRSLAHLRTSMALTAIAIILAGFGIFVGTAWLIGYLMGYPIGGAGIVMAAVILTVILILFQWLLSPLFINLVYRARPPRTPEEKRYEEMLKEVARSSGIKPPKLRIAEVEVPNAFSYGSPLSGSYVAVTRGLLNLMPDEEVKAVLGHEVGHLKHRDVSWLLALSVIPLAVYYLGQMLVWSGFLSAALTRRGGEGPIGASYSCS
jgi:Zn-dependent protease with chaperone function